MPWPTGEYQSDPPSLPTTIRCSRPRASPPTRTPTLDVSLHIRSVIPEHSYGVRPVNCAGSSRPAVCGVRVGGGSASAVVDVCVATHMRGLVPHDRVCEMRSGAVLWRRAWPVRGRSQCSLGSLLASLRRCALLAESLIAVTIPWLRAPSSVRRARVRRRPRRSSGACLAPRVRASVRAAAGRCARPGLVRPGVCRCVCVRA